MGLKWSDVDWETITRFTFSEPSIISDGMTQKLEASNRKDRFGACYDEGSSKRGNWLARQMALI